MWLGQIISNLGDTINYIALVVEVYKISGSGIALSSLALFQIVPVILIGPVAGAIVDRFSRKRVLIAADLARAVLVLGLVAVAIWWEYSERLLNGAILVGRERCMLPPPSSIQVLTC